MSFKAKNAVVWCEIPVADLDKGIAFYNAVFDYGLKAEMMGPNLIAVLPTADGMGVAGHIYAGKTGSGGMTVHLTVPNGLETAMKNWAAAGGKMVSEPIPLPIGRFAYGIDPDGNSIGLFEMAG